MNTPPLQNKPDVLAFFQELFQRLFTKSPKFFVVIQWVLFGLSLVTGVPEFLQSIGVDLPEWADVIANKVVAIAATSSYFISLLAVQRTTPTTSAFVSPETAQVASEKLPFTVKKEVNNNVNTAPSAGL